MGILMVPTDAEFWPSLGGQVCDFIERNMVHGPGDLLGEPVRLDGEKRGLVYRFYEVYRQGHRQAGRRRFKRCGISLRKGSAKTELAAWIVICELHPDAPVRTSGWTEHGDPIGGPVNDPYIPLVAFSEEQSEDLCFKAVYKILENCGLRDDFDLGLERINRKRGSGMALALAAAPNARDGARTTFQHFDETHRMTLKRLTDAHETMLQNIPKRPIADGWTLETTTAPEPGAGSIAESTMEYARAIADGHVSDPRLFFFHREAAEGHDLTSDEGLLAAINEAAGPLAAWSDNDSIMEAFRKPSADTAYLERVWLNRLVKGATQAFSVEAWKPLARKESPVKPGDLITLGFDGAQFHDSTGLVATHIESGYQWVAGLWECPPGKKNWQVPADEVDRTVRALFEQYDVWRLYADPPYWQSWIATWAGDPDMGSDRVVEWWSNRRKPMTAALENFTTALKDGSLTHDGSKAYERHIGNSRKKELPQRDEEGKALWLIQKERPDSPNKIDLAMAGVLSWEARTDAIAAGVLAREPSYQMMVLWGSR